MPLKRFTCPETASQPGRENEFEFCLNECAERCQPRAVLSTIVQQHRHNPHRGDMLSATSLPRCPRKLLLTRTRDYSEVPSKMYDATRGSLIHGLLETQELSGVSVETRIYKVVRRGLFGPFVLSGQVDYYERLDEKLEDYKSIDSDGLYILLRYGIKDDHILQMSVYKWLLAGGHVKPEGWNGGETPGEVATWPTVNWPVRNAQLHFVMMRRVVSTGTTFQFDEKTDFKSPKGPNYGKPYPGEASRQQLPSRGKPKWRITAKLPSVQLLSFEEVEDYVALRGPNLVRGFKEDGYIPPGVMHDPDANWECDFCPVRDMCEDIEKKLAAGGKLALEGEEAA